MGCSKLVAHLNGHINAAGFACTSLFKWNEYHLSLKEFHISLKVWRAPFIENWYHRCN